jgi:hypothetical protein
VAEVVGTALVHLQEERERERERHAERQRERDLFMGVGMVCAALKDEWRK